MTGAGGGKGRASRPEGAGRPRGTRGPRPVGCSLPASLLLLATLVGGAPLAAQLPAERTAGVGAVGVFMVGQGVDVQDAGIGALVTLELRPGGWHGAGVAVEGGWIPLEDDRGAPGQRAQNTLLHLAAGPSWRPGVGRLRPEITLLAGVVSARWALHSPGGDESGAGSAGVLGGLAGLGVELAAGRHPVTLRVQGRIMDPGVLPFGRAPLPSSSPADVGVARWDVVLLSLALGLTVGL